MINMNTWFTSDTHFGHKNICRGTTEWKELEPGSSHQNTRDFNTLEEMDYALVKGINDYVGSDDELWHLGDWSFGGIENIIRFRSQLVCQNINLVFGNHDQHIESGKYLTYMHKDDGITSKSPVTGMKDCFKSVQYYKELSIEGHKICLLHYAMRVWNHSHKNSWHLYGHSHSSLEAFPNGKSIDVGMDNAFNLFKQYRPFSFKEIQSILSKRDINFIDHHSKNTN